MRLASVLMLGVMSFSSLCMAEEKIINDSNKQDLEISIYNQSLALVKDKRLVKADKGINDIAFEGVASQIKPETAILYADGIKVLEQNYDYALLTPQNIAEKSVGKTIKTVVQNPTTGADIFDTAKIITTNYGNPVLQFSYGIEPNFQGRLVYENLPESLRRKPTLVAKIDSDATEEKNVSLAYLTTGISWKTDYVAKVIDNEKLDLTAWVTINNESGVDYSNARVQLISGDVNEVTNAVASPRMMRMASKAVMAEFSDASAGAATETLSGYHLYTLPRKTDIKDKQTKQISLIEKNAVAYKKEAVINSPLYFYPNSNSEFEQIHPDMIYVINNVEESNLGIAMPQGAIRFYENDSQGNMQFIGGSFIQYMAKAEKARLNLGRFFNVFVDGKITKVTKVTENKLPILNDRCHTLASTYKYDVEVTFNNANTYEQEVIFSQNMPLESKILKSSIEGNLKDAGTYEWKVKVPADGKQSLTYQVEAISKVRSCD